SEKAIGAVLEQVVDNQRQPLGFFSRKFPTTESSMAPFDKELTAIFRAIKHFEHMLEGRRFTIYTDHKPIISAMSNSTQKSPKQLRQLSYISEFSTDIRHIKGAHNIVADALSRIEVDAISQPLDLARLAQEQLADQVEMDRFTSTSHMKFR